MPQKQRHRGRHPEDDRLFHRARIPLLRRAVADLSYLLSRDYAEKSALKLVGDRYQLNVRQRRAVKRAACSDEALRRRQTHALPLGALAGRNVVIDGYNLLISVESALSHGVLTRGRDGYIRDMASVHGSYHSVTETLPAIRLIGETLHALGVTEVHWYFDAPVSNSARLKVLLLDEAERRGWTWRVDLVANPDKVIAASEDVVITGDSWILDRAAVWANLMDRVVDTLGCGPGVMDLGACPD